MFKKKINRRTFFKKSGQLSGAMLLSSVLTSRKGYSYTDADDVSHIFLARDNGPALNMEIVIQQMGGIDAIVQQSDIVVIKTNAQWWNQGTPNLAAIKRFIELILAIPGFSGEVIICDNNHRWDPVTYGAWAETFEINSDVPNVYNLIDLIDLFHTQGHNNVSYYCWNDVKGYNGQLVTGPADGDGYVYLTDIVYDNGATGDEHRQTIMTYPVFTSTYSGVTVDLKNGAWKDGNYTDQPVKFIVFSALCYHGTFAGATSAVKNYFGVVDLSGGSNPLLDGKLTDDYYNFHSFSFDKDDPGPVAGVMGGAIGTFMKQVRCADLHVTTAEWVGCSDRKISTAAVQTEIILASTDPVALDYYAAKYVLYPATVQNDVNKSPLVNPDLTDMPFRQYLDQCHAMGIGTLDENKMIIHTDPTPVQLVAFQARLVNRHVELEWQVEQAEGFFGFEVQKNILNKDFYKIGFVEFNNRENNYYFKDDVEIYGKIKYRLKLLDSDGEARFSEILSLDVYDEKTFMLGQNFPNPFNSGTVIQFSISQNSKVALEIYDITGRKVKTLLDEFKYAGSYSYRWDGVNDNGKKAASGFYIYKLKTDRQILSRKMFLLN